MIARLIGTRKSVRLDSCPAHVAELALRQRDAYGRLKGMNTQDCAWWMLQDIIINTLQMFSRTGGAHYNLFLVTWRRQVIVVDCSP